MALAKTDLISLYGRRAQRYDLTANLYYLIGFREYRFRRLAAEALGLRSGDTVVEIGCGTGLNFGLLHEAVGNDGRIVGVDLTESMLRQARHRIARHGWSNVELVHGDAASFEFPAPLDGVISTFALTLMPEYDEIIRRAAAALSPGGSMAVLDFKEPEHWPRWLVGIGVAITRPFGVTHDLMDRRPWRSMQRWFADVRMRELFWGAAYLCVGECDQARDPSEPLPRESQP